MPLPSLTHWCKEAHTKYMPTATTRDICLKHISRFARMRWNDLFYVINLDKFNFRCLQVYIGIFCLYIYLLYRYFKIFVIYKQLYIYRTYCINFQFASLKRYCRVNIHKRTVSTCLPTAPQWLNLCVIWQSFIWLSKDWSNMCNKLLKLFCIYMITVCGCGIKCITRLRMYNRYIGITLIDSLIL